MYTHRSSPAATATASAGYSARRHGDRATSTPLSQANESFTDSIVYSPSVHSEARLTGSSRHATVSAANATSVSGANTGRYTSVSASPPEHFEDANLYFGADAANTRENFRVAVRVRPPLPRELHGYRPFVDVVQISSEHTNTITLCDALDTEDGRGAVYSRQSYTFDRVYGAEATQEDVYALSARPAVLSVLDGYNATLMAYGQTGTGKTYTMEGFTNEDERGIIPRAVEDVFACIHERRSSRDRDTKFLVRASYMQIYNEVISDLLEPPNPALGGRSSLAVRHTPQRGVYVDGLSEWVVRTPEDVYGLIAKGTSLRATSATKLSELSSRSHAIFTIVVEAMDGDEASPTAYRFGKLHIVDLAGSEKIRLAGVTGQRLEETKNINKSLHELGNVIAALAAKSTSHGRRVQRHIPFRNSALTSALRDSLGGNCKTTLIACISPALESYSESLSTLMFANRAKNIQTHAVVNEGVNQATLLRAYEQELRRLRQQLQERTETAAVASNGPDTSDAHFLLSELEEDRRRAESDRAAALAALQKSSVAYQEEMRIRQALEERIRELEAVMRDGGMEGNPRTSQEYADRLMELDRERRAVAEDKEQVERYKHLLLKQRDIMLSLTTRLNDRDETILLLQEEVDAYDRHVLELEDELEMALQRYPNPNTGAPSNTGNSNNPLLSSSPSSGDRRYVSSAFVVNPQAVGQLSEAQATEYIRQLCVGPGRASSSSPLDSSGHKADGNTLRYKSLFQPHRTVTAEELAVELVMLQGRAEADTTAISTSSNNNGASASSPRPQTSRGANNASPPMATSGGASTNFSEKELTAAVQQRADALLRSVYDDMLAQLRATVAGLTLQLHNSEDKAQLLEREADELAARLRGKDRAGNTAAASSAFEELQRGLRGEWEARRRAYASAMDAVQDAVRHDGAELARLSREVDRLRVEVQHALENALPASAMEPSQRVAVSRVWQRLQEMEEKVRQQGLLSHLRALSEDSPQAAAGASSAPSGQSHSSEPLKAALSREKALQTKVEEQQAVIQKLEREAARAKQQEAAKSQKPSPAPSGVSAEEFERVRQQLTVHAKDQRALRTILEQRMRGKIDRICDLLTTGNGADVAAGKLSSEARSLQGLIHASIKAMNTDV